MTLTVDMYSDIYLQLILLVDYVIGHEGQQCIVRPYRTEEKQKINKYTLCVHT
jgi:hypothetical protein